jgi:hypothetical protein
MLLAPEAHTAVPAFAGFDVNRDDVDEHGVTSWPTKSAPQKQIDGQIGTILQARVTPGAVATSP